MKICIHQKPICRENIFIKKKKKRRKKSDAYFKLKICHQKYQMRILARFYSHSALNPSIRMIHSARLHKVFQFYKVELMK